jgi:hypothetical protein
LKNKKGSFLLPTLYFSVVGIFIPGFTGLIILGFQILFTKLGLTCTDSWMVVWTFSSLGAAVLPIVFFNRVRKTISKNPNSFEPPITVFNLVEYTLLQFALMPLFTNGQVACYGSGGQNGLELAFTAWLSLPILILLSFFYDKQLLKRNVLKELLN